MYWSCVVFYLRKKFNIIAWLSVRLRASVSKQMCKWSIESWHLLYFTGNPRGVHFLLSPKCWAPVLTYPKYWVQILWDPKYCPIFWTPTFVELHWISQVYVYCVKTLDFVFLLQHCFNSQTPYILFFISCNFPTPNIEFFLSCICRPQIWFSCKISDPKYWQGPPV